MTDTSGFPRNLMIACRYSSALRLKTARAIIAIGGAMIVVIEMAIAECLFYVYKYACAYFSISAR